MVLEIKSLNKLLENSFRDNWENEALSNYQGETLCYKDLARSIGYIHLNFRQCGLKKGEKVALCSRNQVNWAVAFLASLTYGAVPVPILHEFKPGNIHYLVNHSEARVLFVDEMIWEGLSESEMPGLSVIVQMNNLEYLYVKDPKMLEVKNHTSELFEKQYPDGFGPDDLDYYQDSPDELAVINYTSGTSGFSKGVMIPYRALYTNIYFARKVAEPQMTCESEMVAMLPSAHMYGMMFEFLFEMTLGAHVHFLTRIPSPKVIMSACQNVKPDIIISVPLVIEKIYKSSIKPILDKNKLYLSLPLVDRVVCKMIRSSLIDALGGRFEEVILGGAAFNPEVEKVFRKLHFPFTVGYGMTECAPIITYDKWYSNKPFSCGVPVPGCEIRIDSEDPATVPGEVQVRGSNLFLGYYKNEEATAKAFTQDGWFRTGDIGVIDSDGYLFLRGRSKCMILGPSGQNIYPEELEAVINSVNYVVESLVVDDHGSLVALIYPDYHQAELDGMTGEQLEARLQDALPQINEDFPNYARIKRVEFMPEDFERTPKRSIKRYLYQR